MNKYINPLSDIFVKYLFGSEEYNRLLISFINAVQEDSNFTKIVTAELKNPFNPKEAVYDKETVLDVKAKDETGRWFNIEVQISASEHFHNRSLYYWAKLYSSQLETGSQYGSLKPAVCINLLNFNLFPERKKLHACFLLTDINDPEYILTDHLVIHFLEVKKIEDRTLKDKLLKWIEYFRIEGLEEEKMKILLKDDDIKTAHEAYNKFTKDDYLKEMYEAREKWLMTYRTEISLAKEEGIKEGLKEGMIETAKKMLKRNFSIDEIEDITGLSNEEIEHLK